MRAICLLGLAFGDEGKGACVDALTRQFPVDVIIRYNGGCQTAHNVVLPNGDHHCFSQFGSGMLANETVRTHLSRYMLVEPLAMMNEAAALSKLTPNLWERTTVDAGAVITTPLHSQLNRLREIARGADRHGSCGRGIGVTRELHLKHGDEVLIAGDFQQPRRARLEKLQFIWECVREETMELYKKTGMSDRLLWDPSAVIDEYDGRQWPAQIISGTQDGECMLFEGAQGAMLDEKFGFAPHNTWTDTTFNNADSILIDELDVHECLRIGCIRTYYTRHGQGPFPTEDLSMHLPELHNIDEGFQGRFRQGHFDWQMFNSALTIVDGVDYIAVSHLDYLPDLGIPVKEMLARLEAIRPVGMTANGPTHVHRQFSIS